MTPGTSTLTTGHRAKRLRLAFYGDDFTGSTDALEALVSAGVRAVLFVRPPSKEELESSFPDVEAIGVAGNARAQDPAEMAATLPEIFAGLAALDPEVMHYKVCSTYDSAPEIGNIGMAAELLAGAFGQERLWALGGAPHLGRYLVFGHLFARYGGDGRVYRIDRHPVMRNHPTTPMNESDLRLHLLKQNERLTVYNVMVDALGSREAFEERPVESEPGEASGEVARAGEAEVRTGPLLTLFDSTSDGDGRRFAEAVSDRVTTGEKPLLIGPSAVEDALARVWSGGVERGAYEKSHEKSIVQESVAPVDRLLVLSGSCSPMTDLQIERAAQAGFAVLQVDPSSIGVESHDRELRTRMGEALETQGAAVVAACRGGANPEKSLPPDRLGALFAELLEQAVASLGVRRALVAGGDSSSSTMKRLPVTALEMTRRLAPGVPLCRVHAPDTALEGSELALKGGQLGDRDLFVRAWHGDDSA